MGKIPFRVRPVNFKYEPDDPTEFSGNVTLSSKFVEVHLAEIIDTLQKKDIEELLKDKGGEGVILKTNTVLRLANLPNATTDETKNKYWAGPMLVGLVVGLALVIFLGNDVPALLLLTVCLAAVFGGLVGYVWQKFYEAKIKSILKQYARALLED
jgi:hypothetical protein